MSLGCWNKKHRQVLYKGVDITDKIGLCICDECTEQIRSEIDALLKAKELAATTANTCMDAIALRDVEHYVTKHVGVDLSAKIMADIVNFAQQHHA